MSQVSGQESYKSGAGYPTLSIHELFSQQVARAPQATALVGKSETLSYIELEQRSDDLAAKLIEWGVDKEQVVAILATPQVELIVAVLAILKAGAVYLPLDPKQPQQRQTYMLEDSKACLLLIGSRQQLPQDCPVPVQSIKQTAPPVQGFKARLRLPENLAYINYTSGSTGNPKGVAIPHRGVTSLLYNTNFHDIQASDRVAQLANPAFDAFTFEAWGCLLFGATLYLVDRDLLLDPLVLHAYVVENEITVLHLTTAMFNQFSEAVPQGLSDLRCFYFGGEKATPPAIARTLVQDKKPEKIIQLYGPTENTSFATFSHLTHLDPASPTVPIGIPLSHKTLYLRDPNGDLNDEVGEIFLAGPGLARGYLNRPDLTALAFQPDPFATEPGSRCYKTGDRARRLEDGRLDFRGRIDRQFKLRGFRIEPGEIESCLNNHPSVAEAILLLKEGPGEAFLCSYIRKQDPSQELQAQDLKQDLAQKLPDYMIPAHIVVMDSFPMTPNGKVDKKALPEPDLQSQFSEPETQTEKDLAAIWSECLGLPELGREAHFFDLGGHSLMATRVLTALRAKRGQRVTIQTIFDYPVLKDLAQHLDQNVVNDAPQPIPKRQGSVGLSFAQSRLWFIQKLDPANSAYNMPFAVRINGDLKLDLLKAALRDVSQRHEILRTELREEDGHVFQEVFDVEDVSFERFDLRHLKGEAQDETLREDILQKLDMPFDLTEKALWRAYLYQLADQSHIFVCNQHHIISDGWSVSIFMDELAECYRAHHSQTPANLAPLACQYGDFSQWQEKQLQETVDQQLGWWQENLQQEGDLIDLPTDWPRPARQTYEGAQIPIVLPAQLGLALKALGHQHKSTLYMTLLASMSTLLHRYSGQTTIDLGSPVANRGRNELESLIGFFVNTLVMRGDCAGDPSFLELLERVKQHALGAFSHSDLPFEKLVEALAPERDLSRNPLFQVMFALHNMPELPEQAADLELAAHPLPCNKARFDLSLLLDPPASDGTLTGVWEYNTNLFERDTVLGMAIHFENLLKDIVANPQSKLSSFDMISASERHKLVETWNQGSGPLPELQTIHAIILQRAAKNPQAIAVIARDQSLTYSELVQQATNLAGHLLTQGIGRGHRVGICMERNQDLVVSLLAVLMAGAAYVPLDPSYPKERLDLIARDTQMDLILTDVHSEDVLQGLDVRLHHPAQASPVFNGSLPGDIQSSEPAYILYTSGSTGRPKGVTITHASPVHLIQWASNVYSSEDLAATLAGTSINFDLSIFEIFVTLSQGGSIVLVSSILELVNQDFAQDITLINSVPSAVEELLRLDALPDSVGTVNLAGEPLPPALLETLYQKRHIRAVYNLYGPSEDTTYSTGILLPREPGTRITIGKPINHTQAYVFDRRGQLLPTGVTGELYLGGLGLAQGYWAQPGLTASRFLPNPFAEGQRLYRTGDRVRFLPDGQLMFLGRVDHQIKLRGFRIELGEIQACIEAYPGVEQAIISIDQSTTTPMLQAHVRSQASLSEDALRDHVSNRLPAYMVPSAIMVLQYFPLLPNGKVDRRALPRAVHQQETPKDPPQTSMENRLADIWSELLDIETINRQDHFFHLGGHSLLATRVLSRLGLSRDGEALRLAFEKPVLEQLASALEKRDSQTSVQKIIRRTSPRAPLSSGQQRLWFIDKLQGGSAAYNLPICLELNGPLHQDHLNTAIQELAMRHDVLRTIFDEEEGHPYQEVTEQKPPLVPCVDLSHYPAQERLGIAQDLIAQALAKPVDIHEKAPWWTCVYRLDEQHHLLLINTHHIISDGWTMSLLMRDLDAFYTAACQGTSCPLKALEFGYGDYALAQEATDTQSHSQEELDWWTKQLPANPDPLNLPADLPRPKQLSSRGAVFDFQLDPQRTRAIKDLGSSVMATPFMTLLATWQTLLYRLSGQSTVLIGTPISSRHQETLEDQAGLYVNTLVMASDFQEQPHFIDLLQQVRQFALKAYTHQDLPFERLVEVLAPQRDLSRNPIFQASFVMQNMPEPPKQIGNLKAQPFELNWHTTHFDITLGMREEDHPQGSILKASFEYSTDLFKTETVASFANLFTHLIDRIVQEPQKRLDHIDLLDDASRQRILIDWNDTDVDHGPTLVPQQVYAAAAAYPDHIAVSTDFEHNTTELTYEQLLIRSSQLAHYLREHGIQSGSVVAVCAHRSNDMVVALLAVFLAGATYVPLDPQHPVARRQFMLEDSKAAMLLLGEGETLKTDIPALEIHQDRERWIHMPETIETPEPLAIAPAYIIYTSGSTGTPKGVSVPHQGLANLVAWHCRSYGVTHQDRATLLASPAFDASVWEIWPYLVSGAGLYTPKETVRLSPALLAEWLSNNHISITFCPTPLAVALLDQAFPKGKGPRLLLTGGDKLERTAPENFPAQLINHYGPTESSVVATACPAVATPGQSPPIGMAIDNIKTYIVDQHLQAQPMGVAGELCLSGIGLAHGYLGRPALTAQHFLPCPFSDQPGSRLYKTGDLVRYRMVDDKPSIVFRGRVDHQVKIRGFRIEPGEIDALLLLQEGVKSATTLHRKDQEGDGMLVSYVVTDGPQNADELLASLIHKVPAYMVPASIVILDALPLGPTGKVDRRALPEPQLILQTTNKPLQTPLERAIAKIWCDLLDLEEVSAEDNFFLLGGHSLLATRVLSRLGLALDSEALSLVFEKPILAELAQSLTALYSKANQNAIPHLERGQGDFQTNLSPAQQRMFFLDRMDPGNAAYHLAVAYQVRGKFDRKVLAAAFEIMIQRHESLRTTFPMVDQQPQQHIADEMDFRLAYKDYSYLEDEEEEDVRDEIDTLARKFSAKAFDLEHGPLMRASLLKTGSREFLLMVTMHHIISDGWSMGIFFSELSQIYTALKDEQEPKLQELTSQYADFTYWQEEQLDQDRADQHIDWWRQTLAHPDVLDLPTDKPRPKTQTYRGRQHTFKLSKQQTQQINDLATQMGATPFMVLLTLFKLLLSRYSRQQDISVGTPHANRVHPETERMIGFFVNTLVLRSHLDPLRNLYDTVHAEREAAVAAFAHGEVPFEKLVEALQPTRDLTRNPFFQVLFAYQNTPDQAFKIDGLKVKRIPFDLRTSQFDIALYLTEENGITEASLLYNSDLFVAKRITKMVGHWQNLIQAALDQPNRPIGQLEILRDEERKHLLENFNQTAVTHPKRLNLVDWIESQVAKTPQAMASSDHTGTQLSYQQLNDRANQLAHWLREQGVQPDIPVAVCLERSVTMHIALLGVIKAGGAYMPLDPEYPANRLEQILEGTSFKTVLADAETKDKVPPSGTAFCLQENAEKLAGYNTENLRVTSDDNHLAYIIYTSGSTGTPKGVMNAHHGVVNRLIWMQDYLQLQPGDRVLQKTAYSFDVSVWEFFWPIMVGAELVFAKPGGHRDPVYMVQLISEAKINVLHFVPSMLGPFLEALKEDSCQDLRHVVCSGEALSGAHRDLFHQNLKGARLHNLYGPTEAAIDVTAYEALASHKGESVSIGKPVANTSIYLLDDCLQPVPLGTAGELYIGGDNVGRGYRNRADLTADRFLPDPYHTEAGRRMYRTGDLARFDADGAIHYIGRADFQVKLRGFRIETGEIEAILAGEDSVSHVLVMVREDTPGNPQLVAYIVSTGPENSAPLQAAIESRVPAYMVPSQWVFLPEMPLLPNGKINRKALPAPTHQDQEMQIDPPTDALESRLVAIWEEVLDRKPIGIRNNFFELGGHSLLTVKLMVEIERQLAVNLPVTVLFEQPTIENLADIIRRQSGTTIEPTPLVGLKTTGNRVPLFVVHPLGGLLIPYIQLARELHPDQPLYGFEALERKRNMTITEIAADYIEYMREVQPKGPYQIGGWSMGGIVAIEMAQQLKAAGEELTNLFVFDSHWPWDQLRGIPGSDTPEELPLDGGVEGMLMFVEEVVRKFGPFTVTAEDLENLDEQERFDFVIDAARSAGYMQTDYELEMVKKTYNVSKVHMYALLEHRAQPYHGDMIFYLANECPAERKKVYHNAIWDSVVVPDPQLHEVPGDHTTMFYDPNVAGLAANLETYLDPDS